MRRRSLSPADRETNVAQLSRELSEAFEQQAATAEILNVISNSPTDTQPVFDAIVQSGLKLFPGALVSVALRYGDTINAAAVAAPDPARVEAWRRTISRTPLARNYMHGAALLDRRIVDIPDVTDAPAEFLAGAQNFLSSGNRAITIMPMMRGDEAIGLLSVVRLVAGALSDKQLAVLRTFANQAVIAIENTRLLKELRQRTDDLSESLEQQTATSEVLQVISSTPGDLEPVFKTMLENATRVCGANFGLMNLYEDGRFRSVASYNVPPAYTESLATRPAFQPHPQSALGTVARTRQVVHIADIRDLPAYREGDPSVTAIADRAGARSYFVVPMLKENELIGAITIYRQEVKPFAEKQTEVVSNFASQAVIAIENARLLNELRQRTTELSQSLDELRTAQDRLVQTEKLASLGQLTAGIAHEIKNPLNFVNNFSSLSTELIDELNDVIKTTTIDGKTREEIDELTHMLKGNLEKVVQHGKRADSIVKNMLLHSREGSGEHRPADINAIVEESLNLAYHGARAEKSGFNITLKRDLDPAAGMIDVYPQEITRVFLNLISNGFYAATKRKESAGDGFEPTLSATTRNLGGGVEIRIRDNGTGIPAEVKEKMFNPFFTTKPAGEGTGLGLSMSHDIVVKQHGGKIDVDTEPGNFTEFIITLPRTGAAQARA
jgi:signal transduction histidine kinase